MNLEKKAPLAQPTSFIVPFKPERFYTLVNSRTGYMYKVNRKPALYTQEAHAKNELSRLRRIGDDHYYVTQVELRELKL